MRNVYIWPPNVGECSCNLFIAHLVFERFFSFLGGKKQSFRCGERRKPFVQQLSCQDKFPVGGCEIPHVVLGADVFIIVVPPSLFQGHGSHWHLLGSASEQDPDQRPGNAVPDATDPRKNGSCLRAFHKEKNKTNKIIRQQQKEKKN